MGPGRRWPARPIITTKPPPTPTPTESELEAHAAHCHVGPAHCGGGESMIGTAFVGDTTEGLALPGHETMIYSARTLAALTGHPTLLLQPPRSA